MNTTARTALRLLVATPLAASALVIGGHAGIANADTPGFEPNPGLIIVVPDDEDPKPQGPGNLATPKDTDPKPQGPGNLANPKDNEDPKPQGPGNLANPKDNEDPKPQGPGDLANPEDNDDPTPDGPGDLANPEPGDNPDDVPADDTDEDTDEDIEVSNSDDTDQVKNTTTDIQVPHRIDAGTTTDDGLHLAWLLTGGGLLTAAGSLLARRKLTSNR